jgi:ABC-type uncharacterized transport system fused permease/ATPase subunit
MADTSHSDRTQIVRFWASARGFWRGKSGMIAWPLTVGLVVIAVLQLAVQYRLNYWNRDFFNALARHDVKTATDSPVDLTLGLVNSVMTAGVFTGVLWSIGGGLTVAVGGLMVTIPGYLVVGAVLYALVFTGVMLLIGRNLPSVIQMQSQSEAEFLAAANEIRESGNHPASDLDLKRQSVVWDALSQVLLRWRQLLWQLMGTTFVSQTDLLFAPVFAVLTDDF